MSRVGLCPGYALVEVDHEQRDSPAGHNPRRDIVDLGVAEQDLYVAQIDLVREWPYACACI
jgi:hypothetical protein